MGIPNFSASLISARPVVAAFLLSALASISPVTAATPGSPGSASVKDLEAKALSRLSGPDLRAYFAALRQIEQRSSSQRLTRLKSLEGCLELTRLRDGAGECLKQNRQLRRVDREQSLRELNSLRARYKLPQRQPGQSKGGVAAEEVDL
jgi:hypothetical protein